MRSGKIYLMRSGDSDKYKIGRTTQSVSKRRKTLKTGNPDPIRVIRVWEEVPSHVQFEGILHAVFCANRDHQSDATEFFEFQDVDRAIDRIEHELVKHVERTTLTASLSREQESDSLVEADEALRRLVQRRREARAQAKLLEQECHDLDALIKKHIGGNAGIGAPGRERALVTWQDVRTRRFDVKAFREAHAELYDSFVRDEACRRFTVHD